MSSAFYKSVNDWILGGLLPPPPQCPLAMPMTLSDDFFILCCTLTLL